MRHAGAAARPSLCVFFPSHLRACACVTRRRAGGARRWRQGDHQHDPQRKGTGVVRSVREWSAVLVTSARTRVQPHAGAPCTLPAGAALCEWSAACAEVGGGCTSAMRWPVGSLPTASAPPLRRITAMPRVRAGRLTGFARMGSCRSPCWTHRHAAVWAAASKYVWQACPDK